MRRRRLFSTSDWSVSRSALADRLGRLERAAAAKTASRAKSRCSSAVEQPVAPLDRRARGSLPAGRRRGRRVSRSRRSETRSRICSGESALHAGGGELDRERQAVQRAADLAADGVVDLDFRRDGARPRQEELDRPRLGQRRAAGTRCSPRSRSGSRLVTRSAKTGHVASKRPELGSRIHDVLEVVEDQQAGAVADVCRDITVGAYRAATVGSDERWVAKRSEWHRTTHRPETRAPLRPPRRVRTAFSRCRPAP